MTREETLRLLKAIRNAYPNQKILDPKGTADWWESEFGGEDARVVYMATKLHISSSPYLPTPADIRQRLTKAAIVLDYQKEKAELKKVTPPEAPRLQIAAGTETCPDTKTCILYHDLCNGPENNNCPFEGI